MKMYPELCREILLRTEETEGFPPLKHYEVEGFSADEVGYNSLMLNKARLLEVLDARSRDNLWGYYPKHLTPSGHDFLKRAKDNRMWTKALDHLKANSIPLTLEAIKLALSQGWV